jgi:hypothetical protein
MGIDFTKLVKDILDAVKGVVDQGFRKIKTHIDAQVKRLAMRTKILAELRLSGELSETDFNDELEREKDLVKAIGMSVAALAIITLEKAWNAIVKVVWGTLNGVLGAAGFGLLALPPAPMP